MLRSHLQPHTRANMINCHFGFGLPAKAGEIKGFHS